MIPIISIIGRFNVGKSTFFNQLTHTNNALVSNLPGTTRDRKYGFSKLIREFVCIDTGGIDDFFKKKSNTNEMSIAKQSILAIKESDIVFFLVDAKDGLMSLDIAIFDYLQNQKKLIFLIVNKIDGTTFSKIKKDFFLLNFEKIYPISALHRLKITNFLKMVFYTIDRTSYFSKKKYIAKKEIESSRSFYFRIEPQIKVSIVGRPNVGKSTLINCILGEDRMVVQEVPGTTRESIHIPTKIGKNQYILTDTAGIRKRKKITELVEKFSIKKTFQSIKESNVAILVIDAKEGIFNQDLSIIRSILRYGSSLIVVINKCDLLGQKKQKQLKERLNYYLNFIRFVRFHYVSAIKNEGIESLFESIYETYHSSVRRISTSKLIKTMNMAIENHHPPSKKNHIKLKYAHVINYNPITITIYGNQVSKIPSIYKSYLSNYFCKSLKIIGTPIFFNFIEK